MGGVEQCRPLALRPLVEGVCHEGDDTTIGGAHASDEADGAVQGVDGQALRGVVGHGDEQRRVIGQWRGRGIVVARRAAWLRAAYCGGDEMHGRTGREQNHIARAMVKCSAIDILAAKIKKPVSVYAPDLLRDPRPHRLRTLSSTSQLQYSTGKLRSSPWFDDMLASVPLSNTAVPLCSATALVLRRDILSLPPPNCEGRPTSAP